VQNSSYTYENPGTYAWKLTVTDSASGMLEKSGTVIVSASQPLSLTSSASPTSGQAPLSVAFSSAVSGGVPPYVYDWDFGDGSSHASVSSPTHVYQSPGDRVWWLTVIDGASKTATGTGTITVQAPPVLTVQAEADPATGPAPLSVLFTAYVAGGQAPYTVWWFFGDDTPSENGQEVQHTYSRAGTYQWTANVRDSAGGFVSRMGAVVVTDPAAPAITAQATPTSGAVPLTVSFSCSAAGGTPPYGFAWDFGDGSAGASGTGPQHVYTAPGRYTWRVTVSDSSGESASASGIVQCVGPAPVISTVVKQPSPFRLVIRGSGFHGSCTVYVDGLPVPQTVWRAPDKVVAKGSGLKTMIHKGVQVMITVKNNDDGGVSEPFAFSR
jgi:PKD repeat protein